MGRKNSFKTKKCAVSGRDRTRMWRERKRLQQMDNEIIESHMREHLSPERTDKKPKFRAEICQFNEFPFRKITDRHGKSISHLRSVTSVRLGGPHATVIYRFIEQFTKFQKCFEHTLYGFINFVHRNILRWLGKLRTRDRLWNVDDIDEITNVLMSFNETKPSDIHRRFRQLKYINNWKGTELRSVLLYAGIVLFRKFLPPEEYILFLKLSCAYSICSTDAYRPYIELAMTLFKEYIEGYIDFYGIDSITSNVHNLSHIVDDVKEFGNLNSISTYEFENSLHHIKLLLRQCNQPLQQLSRRLLERSKQQKPFSFEINFQPQTKFEFVSADKILYRQIEYRPNFILRDNMKDQWILLKNNIIVQFECAFEIENVFFVRGRPLNQLNNFFTRPFDSKHMNIFISDGQKSEVQNFNLNYIKAKLFCLKFEGNFVFCPLLHTL